MSSTAPPGGNVVSMTGNCSDGIGVKATGNWKERMEAAPKPMESAAAETAPYWIKTISKETPAFL